MSPAVPLSHHCAAISFLSELFLGWNSIQWGWRIKTQQDTASVTRRLQIVPSPEQEQIPHWSHRHSVWAQQPVCSLNNDQSRSRERNRQEAAMGRCVVVLGATPAIAEGEIPDDFRVGEA